MLLRKMVHYLSLTISALTLLVLVLILQRIGELAALEASISEDTTLMAYFFQLFISAISGRGM